MARTDRPRAFLGGCPETLHTILGIGTEWCPLASCRRPGTITHNSSPSWTAAPFLRTLNILLKASSTTSTSSMANLVMQLKRYSSASITPSSFVSTILKFESAIEKRVAIGGTLGLCYTDKHFHCLRKVFVSSAHTALLHRLLEFVGGDFALLQQLLHKKTVVFPRNVFFSDLVKVG